MRLLLQNSDKINWNKRALKLAEQTQNKKAQQWMGSLYNNLGRNYMDDGQYEQALLTYRKALEYRLKENNPMNIRIAKWAIGQTLRKMNRNEEALAIQQALIQEQDNTQNDASTTQPNDIFKIERGLVYRIAEIYYAMKDKSPS